MFICPWHTRAPDTINQSAPHFLIRHFRNQGLSRTMFYNMKTKLLLSLLLATALCFYGCDDKQLDEPQDVPVIVDPTDGETEEPENGSEGDGNSSQGDENTSTDEDDDDGEEADEVDPWFSEPGDGTKDSPYSVSQILEMMAGGTYDPEKGYYVKGIVTRIPYIEHTSEGYRLSYYISEYGNYNEDPYLYVWLGYSFDGERFSSKDDISVGDKVIVYGILTDSRLNDGMLYYLNGVFNDYDYADQTKGDDEGDLYDPSEDDENYIEDVCIYMTDVDFRKYCYANFDTDGNGKVSSYEANAVTKIQYCAASDWTGIEYFPNLQFFSGSSNTVTLDLSHNTELTEIYLSTSCITELDLSCNTKLETLKYKIMYGGTFEECKKLTSIILPESLTSVGERAFKSCEALPSVSLPKGVTSIGDYAFSSCYNLSLILLPDNITSIGYNAFAYSGLTSITIPDGVTEIENDTFYDCKSLQSVKLSKNLTAIKYAAFEFCESLTEITNTENLTSIGEWAFYKCTSLTSISIENVTSIDDYAFSNCENLESITFPKSLTMLSNAVFYGCTSLTSIILPEDLSIIGTSAFRDCSALKSVTVKAMTPPVLSSRAFDNIDSSAVLYVPSSSIDAYENSDWADYFSKISAL